MNVVERANEKAELKAAESEAEVSEEAGLLEEADERWKKLMEKSPWHGSWSDTGVSLVEAARDSSYWTWNLSRR